MPKYKCYAVCVFHDGFRCECTVPEHTEDLPCLMNSLTLVPVWVKTNRFDEAYTSQITRGYPVRAVECTVDREKYRGTVVFEIPALYNGRFTISTGFKHSMGGQRKNYIYSYDDNIDDDIPVGDIDTDDVVGVMLEALNKVWSGEAK